MGYKKIMLLFTILIVLTCTLSAQTGRWEENLSGKGWSMWLDRAATWYNDSIFLPPVNILNLPVNPPTCGWENLDNQSLKLGVKVPGTVEEYYWGKIGGAIPDTGGNYVGVSWWSKKFNLDSKLQGKRITFFFESVNLRAEVFVNGKLVGYDVIGNTPFEVDATDAVVFDKENRLDIRITDPVGNFSWDDNILMRWGHNLVPAVHGFGGITGDIIVRATDAVSINDIYVQNQKDPKRIKVFVILNNYSGRENNGKLSLVLHEKGNPSAIIFSKDTSVKVSLSESQTFTFSASVPNAKLWELSGYKTNKAASLYEADITYSGDDKITEDNKSQIFGFRWFEVGEKDGDKRFYLNGKRVVLLAAMSRGFWPKNGIFPTKEMATRDFQAMIDFGMNTMYMHRAIGQVGVNKYADSVGIFTYEEPGGYRLMPNQRDGIIAADDQARAWRKEKLKRMIIRDRSFPSSIIYYLKNEAIEEPDEDDINNMKMVKSLDPSRVVQYNSGSSIRKDPQLELPTDSVKLHSLAYSNTMNTYGWWDQHHWFAYSGYVDEMYNNPRFYLRGVVSGPRVPLPKDSLYRLDKKEIIFWGEEGAFGTMVRLQKIKEELDSIGDTGFREKEHLDWYNYYNNFLDKSGFRRSYPNVDSLTMSLGRNLAYFHGRNIENVRLSNIGDAYNMNGWGSASTRTDVVDMYRNPTADVNIIRHYTRPLYIAVKLRNKVVSVGTAPVVDLFIINEKNLKGKHTLHIRFSDPNGNILLKKEYIVDVSGGEIFGQLLVENVQLPIVKENGYYRLDATLDAGDVKKADGFDDLYVVDINDAALANKSYAVMESDNIIKSFLKKIKGITVTSYDLKVGRADVVIVGANAYGSLDYDIMLDLMKRVQNGTRLVVLENADMFAEEINSVLKNRPPVYKGGGIIDWGGSGRLFVGQSNFLSGLPQSQGMSWEYQCFYKGSKVGESARVAGLRINNWGSELVVALGNQGSKEILTALTSVPVGRGRVILSTLNILPNLLNSEQSAIVAQKLFLNLLK